MLRDKIVALGSMSVENRPLCTLHTPPLGTAVAVAIFDPVNSVGGLLACILPDSTLDEARGLDQPCLFVDTGLQALLNEFTRQGGQLSQAHLHAAGGMEVIDGEKAYDLGPRNAQMLQNLLPVYGLTLASAELGGYFSVSLSLDLDTGEIVVKRPGQQTKPDLCRK
ncbi:chemotaxis protein CheD [Fontisphaera persica]|uniref:chemotaxis protein CheD n=1 Tax=Fontisphaera persica TaxID=2974023 RepID=UPI0024C00FDD|nr:chemotaxis protein CheD [Fontisphaera persica]WCJ58184.1 chemotaxis protein CheD [Fontisphaera persica]